MPTFGVIGSGPSGLTAIKTLLSINPEFDVTLIDIGDIFKDRGNEKHLSINLKTYKGSNFPYDLANPLMETDKSSNAVWNSKAFGGFSKVWGAVIDSQDAELFGTFSSKYTIENNPSFRSLHQVGLLKPQSLAVDGNKCIKCGECLIGCPTNAIWSSEFEIKKLLELSQIRFTRGRVSQVQETSSAVAVLMADGHSLSFDYVLLCMGAIGNLICLLKSDLVKGPIKINDSQTYFMLFLKRPNQLNMPRFALSQGIIQLEHSSQFRTTLQIYPDIRDLSLRYRTNSRILNIIVKVGFELMSRFTFVGIGYLPERFSGKMAMNLNSHGKIEMTAVAPKPKLAIKVKTLQLVVRNLIKHGIVPIYFKFAGVGEGYHFGYRIPNSINESIQRTGSIRGKERVLILDSALLNEIPVGNLTSRVMRTIENIIRGRFS